MKFREGVSKTTTVVIAVVVIVLILATAAALTLRVSSPTTTTTSSLSSSSATSSTSFSSTTTSSTSPSTSSSSSSVNSSTSSSSFTSTTKSSPAPTVLTYETIGNYQFLDPSISWSEYDATLLQNVYDPLIWYNGTSPTETIPWLAQNYSISPDGRTVNFTLRSGVKFADGENLNSTAVYFTFNRLLVEDGSTPVSHGSQASFFISQLVNTSLSSTLCGCSETYNDNYVNDWLSENFVQITGPLTFTLHVNYPTTSFPYLLSNEWGFIVAPDYVMQKDLSLWVSQGYNLPFATLSGNSTNVIQQYLDDEAATCNTGATPSGCGETYLDNSAQGSLAGTGPYLIENVSTTTSDVVMKSNPNWWGGPYQTRIVPQFTTVYINFVASLNTRELDLKEAAASGNAMAIDLPATNIYDVANRSAWVDDNKFVSILPGVQILGPYSSFTTDMISFDTNVTNPITGSFYQFQPFADVRFRLAFADSVNMSELNSAVNNNLGQVAVNGIPPNLPPADSYNASNVPVYSYDPDTVQNLLLEAMESPLTHFTFVNGTVAPSDLFNNTFGCSSANLNSNGGTCKNPVPQTITLVYPSGDTVSQELFTEMADVVNNVSDTYNMGLTVSIVPVPLSVMLTESFSDQMYMYSGQYVDDYPYVLDFLGGFYVPGFYYPASDGWNITIFKTLYDEALSASAVGNISQLLSISNAMNSEANQIAMYLWTFYPLCYMVSTSNVQGFEYNPSLSSGAAGSGVAGPEYFASLY